MSKQIRVLELAGSPYDLGYQHGRAYREAIRHYAADRLQLVCSGQWSKHALPPAEVLAVAEACLPDHEAYAPDLMKEWRGMAEATGLSLAELLIVGGFTDFVDTIYNLTQHPRHVPVPDPIDDCTAFIVPDGLAEGGAGFFGQTWDMHDTATPYVVLLRLRPADGPGALVFTTTGCVGQLGMNTAGIAVGINNLLGADGQLGVTWPFVVRQVLNQTSLESALACITQAKLAGAHNYLLFDHTGRGYNIEAMSTHCQVTPLEQEVLVHTNHCLVPQTNELAQIRLPESQASSERRLAKAHHILQQRPIRAEHLMELTREGEDICMTAKPPFHLETCGAAIMRPKSGDFWAVWGLPTENEYQHFQV